MQSLCRDVAQLGSALRLGRRGRTFESCHPDHFKRVFLKALFLFVLILFNEIFVLHLIDLSCDYITSLQKICYYINGELNIFIKSLIFIGTKYKCYVQNVKLN